MSYKPTEDERTAYVERWGVLFEILGATRMMGKILGWLLISDPPEQSAAEIAIAVRASAGTVSTTTRALVQASMIEKVGIPGKRSAHFRVRPGMWGNLMRARLQSISVMEQLADEGLDVFPDPDGDPNTRLREVSSYCRFVNEQFPKLFDDWATEWEKERNR